MLNPIEKFKRSILHLNRSLHHWSYEVFLSGGKHSGLKIFPWHKTLVSPMSFLWGNPPLLEWDMLLHHWLPIYSTLKPRSRGTESHEAGRKMWPKVNRKCARDYKKNTGNCQIAICFISCPSCSHVLILGYGTDIYISFAHGLSYALFWAILIWNHVHFITIKTGAQKWPYDEETTSRPWISMQFQWRKMETHSITLDMSQYMAIWIMYT